jgi:hypothetical protein
MSTDPSKLTNRFRLPLSLDVWAVIAAFALAAFVRAGVLKHVPW